MPTEITPLFLPFGGPEIIVIFLIAVLLFGANKIPKLARSTGEAMGEFQKGREEVEQELEEIRDGKTKSPSSTDVDSTESDDVDTCDVDDSWMDDEDK